MVVAMKVDYHRLKQPAVVFSVLGLTTFLLILVFFLDRSHHTHRWIHLGRVFRSNRPRLAKPALIFFLAFFLENRTRSMDDWRNTLLPAVIPTLVFLGLIVHAARPGNSDCLRRHHGLHSVCRRSAVALSGLWLRSFDTARFYFLIFPVTLIAASASWPFLNPYSDPQRAGFHIIQSLIAVSTGGTPAWV